ncbi:MAG: DUF5791 family protein [Halobacteriales archaeon]
MFANVDADTTEEAIERYAGELRAAVREVGSTEAADATDLDDAVIKAITASDVEIVGRMHLTEVAPILALTDDRNAEAIAADARDELLFAMSAAVTDVERLTASLDTNLDPKEIQAKMEGRYPMRLREYAALRTELMD